MKSKLTNICAQLSPGVSGFALITVALGVAAIGIALAGSWIGGRAVS